jgi:transposase InsO family protein
VVNIVEATGHTMKVLQSDSITVATAKNIDRWLVKRGIQLRLSAPYVHSQNGMIERDMGYVMETARTMMYVYNNPLKFWNYAIDYAVYTINRTHVSATSRKLPMN